MPSARTLSASEIADVAAAAGFDKSKDMLTTAVAVALAESSGRTAAVSSTGCCHGLWQINTEVHPYSKAQMQDPAQNAAAAWSISKQGTTWKPWSAYTNKSYLMFMPTAKAAVRTTPKGAGNVQTEILDALIETDTNPVSTIADIAQYPEMVRQWLSDRNNIMRIAKVAMGIALVIAGAVIVMKPALENVAGGAVGIVTKGLTK